MSVLHFKSANTNPAYGVKTLSAPTEVWVTLEIRVPAAAFAAIPTDGDFTGYFLEILDESAGVPQGLFFQRDSGVVKLWALDATTGPWGSFVGDTYYMVELRVVAGSPISSEIYVNGTTVGSLGPFLDAVSFSELWVGDDVPIATDEWFIRNITVGTTRGASNLWNPSFGATVVPPFTSEVVGAGQTLQMSGDPGSVDGRVLIALDDNALEASPVWTRIDDTPNLISGYDIHTGRQTEFDQTEVGTATVYINDTEGLFDPDNTGSPYFGNLDGKQILLQLYDPVGEEWVPQWRGFIDDFRFDFHEAQVVSNIQLECVDIFEYLAGVEMLPGTFGDTPPAGSERTVFYEDGDVQTRITQLLADAGLDPDMYRVFTGNVDVTETKYDSGDSILVALRDAADAEFPGIANLYVDKFGRFIFHGRKARFDPETTMIGSDWDFTRWKAGDGAAIALDSDRAQIRPPLQWSRPRSRIINAALAWPRFMKDADMPGQIVVDATSRTAFGYRSWSATDLIVQVGTTTLNNAKDECKLFASYYVANYKDPRTRVEALTFRSVRPDDPRATSTWALICGADISDVIDLEHGYPGGEGISENFYIEGYEMNVRALNTGFDDVTVSFNVTPAAYYSDDVFA